MRKTIFLSFFILISVLSCKKADPVIYSLPDEADKLIAGKIDKTWKIASRHNNNVRMNMGDCFLSYRITYNTDYTLSDNNGLQDDCGESLNAIWDFYIDQDKQCYLKYTSDQIPDLMHVDRNFKYFKILKLTKDTLQLQFRHTQFNNKKTTIVDVFVPEGVNVKDRDFHW